MCVGVCVGAWGVKRMEGAGVLGCGVDLNCKRW
jgi:hypothetical protein